MNNKGEITWQDAMALGFGGILSLLFVILIHSGEIGWGLFTFAGVILVWLLDFNSSNSISVVFIVSGVIELGLGNKDLGILLIVLSFLAFFIPRLYHAME